MLFLLMNLKAALGSLLLAEACVSFVSPVSSDSQKEISSGVEQYKQRQQKPYFDFKGYDNIYAVLVNGDSWDAKHIGNIMQAEEVLGEIGVPPENMYSVSRRFTKGQRPVPSPVHVHSNRTTSLEIVLAEVQQRAGENDLIFFYVTGHGVDAQGGCIDFPNGCYGIDTFIEKLSFMKEKNIDGIFLFDMCYSGSFPEKIINMGISVKVMTPAEGTEETKCQFFTPFFWTAVEKGVDYNNNGRATFFDAFRFAMTHYRNTTGTKGEGTYRETIPELTMENYEQFIGNSYPVLVDITASWCGPCQKMQPEIDKLKSRYGDNLTIVKLREDFLVSKNPEHYQQNPEYHQLIDRLGIKVRAIPTLVFLQGSHVETVIGYRTAEQLSEFVESNFSLSWKGIEDIKFEESMEKAHHAYYAILGSSALVLGTAWFLHRKRRKK